VDVDAWPGLPCDFFALDCCRIHFSSYNDTMQKNLSVFAVEVIIHMKKPFLLASIHAVSNFFAFESFLMFLIAWKWLIEQLPMILQILLAFDLDLHQVMPLWLRCAVAR